MKVGVLSLQGDVEEHEEMTYKAFERLKIKGEVIRVKNRVDELDALIIPGGESTTIGALSLKDDLLSDLRGRIIHGQPTLATCAGLIFLAKKVYDRKIGATNQPTLGVLDVMVERNAFGRQKESFETYVHLPILGKEPFHAVFIRAPLIREVGENVSELASLNGMAIAIRQQNVIATSFHPELTEDARIHELLLKMALKGHRMKPYR
jgi:5'-phosphate synthase pdxT subunit